MRHLLAHLLAPGSASAGVSSKVTEDGRDSVARSRLSHEATGAARRPEFDGLSRRNPPSKRITVPTLDAVFVEGNAARISHDLLLLLQHHVSDGQSAR